MKPSGGYPTQGEIELPLLKVLVKYGGSIEFSRQKSQITDELADLFALTPELRQHINRHGKNHWQNHIQYVRLRLVEKNEINKGVRDCWLISDKGRKRVEADPLYQAEEQARILEQKIKDDCDALYGDQEAQGYKTPDGSPTYYERNPAYRKQAIQIHGTSCMVCGLNFAEFYGNWGELYIEVHHIVPISDVPESSDTDPERDMIVVCANCHRMIHRKRRSALCHKKLRSLILHERQEYGLPRDRDAVP